MKRDLDEAGAIALIIAVYGGIIAIAVTVRWMLGGYFVDSAMTAFGKDAGYLIEHLIGFVFTELSAIAWLIGLIFGS